MSIKDPLTLAFLLLSSLLFAQGEEQFLPSDLKQMTVITEPATLRKGFIRTGVSFSHVNVKQIFNNDREKELISGASSARAVSLGFWSYLGITDRMEASLYIPYMMNRNENVLILDNPVSSQSKLLGAINGYGLGDVSIGFRTQVLTEKERQPSFTLGVYIDLPTGRKNPSNVNGILDYDEATGTGEISLDVNLQVRKIVYPYSFVFYSGIDYKMGGNKIHLPGEAELPFRSGNHYYSLAGINFHLNDWICITNDFRFSLVGQYTKNNALEGEIGWEVVWTPNIHFQIRKIRIAQGFNVPVKGRNTGADPGFILFLQYLL